MSVARFISVVIAFVVRDFKIDFSYKFQFFSRFLYGIFSLTSLYFLGVIIGDNINLYYGGVQYFPFVLVGVVFNNFLHIGLNSFTDRLRYSISEGTLEVIFQSPIKPSLLLLFPCFWDFTIGLLHIAMSFSYGAMILGVSFPNANYVSALVIIVLSCIAFSGIGIVASGIVILTKRGDPLRWLATQTATLLGGVLYPVSVLPWWLQLVSVTLPITHALNGLRLALLEGASISEMALEVSALAGFASLVFPVGLWFNERLIAQAKTNGALATY